jgi:hypothetical protein
MPSYCSIEEAWGENFQDEENKKTNEFIKNEKKELQELDGFSDASHAKSTNSQFPFDESIFKYNGENENTENSEKWNIVNKHKDLCESHVKHITECEHCYNMIKHMISIKEQIPTKVETSIKQNVQQHSEPSPDQIIENFTSPQNTDTVLYSIFGILLIFIFDSIIQNKFSK